MRLKFGIIVFFYMLNMILVSCKTENKSKTELTGDPEIDAITAEINKDPGNALLYYERAKMFYKKSIYDRTYYDLKEAMMIDSLNPDFYHLLSDTYLDNQNSNAAINVMAKVISIYPERIPSLLKMAELKHILKDYDGSLLTLNEIVRIDPQNADAYFMLGMNFKSLGDNERAVNAFQTAVEFNSSLTDAWIILGEMYEAKKDPKAIKYYESAILSNPNSMQALHAKAYYLQNHGDIPGAQKIYRQIIVTDKSYSDAYLNSGLLYLDADSLDRAQEVFNLMKGVAPANYMGHYLSGVVNEKKGNKSAALLDYESAHNLNNKDKKVSEALEKLKKQ